MSELASAMPDDLVEERRTTPIEMLWDLVFVFAVTQVTSLMSGNITWTTFGEGMLVLALVWWAWSAFVWAANAQPATSWSLRFCLLTATVFIFITGLAVPRAFLDESTLFAITYAVVRFLHLALYADASRRGSASWASISGFAVTVAIGMALLVAGSFLNGPARACLWTLAVVIDYAGPAWLTRERLRGLQSIAVGHFAERYSLFVIICLGESIVAIGVAARSHAVSAELAAISLGLLITVGMWWTYFDRFAATAEARLREHDDPVLAASDAYSYVHLLIVAGIIIFAVGLKFLVRGHIEDPLTGPARLTLCGGVALYLIGNVGFRLRMTGSLDYVKLTVAVALCALYVAGGGLPAWATAGAITFLVAALCWLESGADRERGE